MNNIEGGASVIIVTYNHAKYIRQCLESVAGNHPVEIIVIDNGSTDGTPGIVAACCPTAVVQTNEVNIGFGSACNQAMKIARGEHLVFLNPDTTVSPNWLERLVSPLEKGSRILSVPHILMYDGSAVNADGNVEHFTGLAFARNLGAEPSLTDNYAPAGISGACFATRKEEMERIGGFDENLFCYMEDVELSWRAHVQGMRFVVVSDSIVFHDYRRNLNDWKLYHLERGRYYILRKYLTWREVLGLLPSFVATESLTWGLGIRLGVKGVVAKSKALIDGGSIRVGKESFDRRPLLKSLDIFIPPDSEFGSTGNVAIKVANAIYRLNSWVIGK